MDGGEAQNSLTYPLLFFCHASLFAPVPPVLGTTRNGADLAMPAPFSTLSPLSERFQTRDSTCVEVPIYVWNLPCVPSVPLLRLYLLHLFCVCTFCACFATTSGIGVERPIGCTCDNHLFIYSNGAPSRGCLQPFIFCSLA